MVYYSVPTLDAGAMSMCGCPLRWPPGYTHREPSPALQVPYNVIDAMCILQALFKLTVVSESSVLGDCDTKTTDGSA